ncbi:MAG TPA: glycosyltransferase family 2 protein [Solirubrobacteraceae bacterium]|nr:glycosyltransferase family 2 protein [Solirubrobacteraceae bacterium]
MAPSIDVVVPVHDRYELTRACLTHLAAQSEPHRVIVVDDGSSDGTPERLRSEWPQVTVVSLEGNQGFASACNRGAKEGSGELVVLLNNDVECEPAFLERLRRPFADPRVGSVATLMLRPGGEAIDSAGLATDVTLAGFPRQQGLPAAAAGDEDPVLAGPAGAAAGYRRAAWEQVGGLDEGLVAYMEDLDLALRLRIAGWSAVLASDAVGVHLGSATYGRRGKRQRRLAGFSRGYLLRRYGVLHGRAALRALATESIVVAGDLVISHDLAALQGRLAGWRAAANGARQLVAPPQAIDRSIGLRESLHLRRGIYGSD